MSSRPVIYLHIGAMKTGTTFLQKVLLANKQRLAEQGVLYPGKNWADQVRATSDLIGRARNDLEKKQFAGMWDAMVDDMLAYDGRAALMSMEFLSFASPQQVKRAAATLRGVEVHVILGVRDAMSVIPAQWQTSAQNAGTVSWRSYVADLEHDMQQGPGGKFKRIVRARRGDSTAEGERGSVTFKRAAAVPRMLSAWSELVPPERLHVLTTPPSGADPLELWRRFCSITGIDAESTPPPVEQANVSLGRTSSDLMIHVNRQVTHLPRAEYTRTVKQKLAEQVLPALKKSEPKISMPSSMAELGAAWNAQVREAIVKSGAHVVGSLDELPTTPRPTTVSDEDAVADSSTADLLATAAYAVNGMFDIIAEREQELRKTLIKSELVQLDKPGPDSGRRDQKRRLAELVASGYVKPDEPYTAERWADRRDPVTAAAAEIAAMCQAAINLRVRRIQLVNPTNVTPGSEVPEPALGQTELP